MINILGVVSSFYPYRGGSGLGHFDVLKRIAVSSDYRIRVLTYNFGGNKATVDIIDNITVFRMACWVPKNFVVIPKPNVSNIAMVFRLLKIKHNIVYTRARYSPMTLLGLLISLVKHIPLLHTEVSISIPYRTHWYSGMFAWLLNHTLGLLITRNAYCVAVSKDAEKDMLKMNVRHIKQIYNGIDREIFYAKRNESCVY